MSPTHPSTRLLATTATLVLAAGLVAVGDRAEAQQTIGFPVFTGGDAVPDEPVDYTVDGMMPAMYEAEADGTDFWMDRLLAREGADPAGDQWLMTRGRALLMRVHDPDVIGFGGQLAYYDPFFDRASNTDGFVIDIGEADFTEVVDERRQTPSHWTSVHESDNLTAEVQKFITHNNVAVANVTVTNDGAAATVPLRVESDFAWQADGDELTGVLDVQNSRGERLTTVFPRLSGTGLAPEDGALTGELTLEAGESATFKVQLGMITDEIPESATEYAAYRDAAPQDAFAEHVQTYNRWWAENIPYFDVPDEEIKKFIYYRWWLMRYNYLDADIPGNDFQFPTSIEGVTGYNNAIALTVPMFIDDLKYLRNPVYSYGPWVSTGESSEGGRFMDNPGDPENWSNSYTQYIAEAAWRSYQIHGGQTPIVENLATYAEGDVRGQLETFDTDGNWLIEYDWGAMTGNDADAVSFHWREGNLDRTESAYQYSGALAAAEAYELLGDEANAAEMREIADNIQNAILEVLWNPERQLFEHVHTETGDHVPWKEINNYYPFSVGAIPNEEPYTDALRLFADPDEYPIFPFYTANQADKAEAAEAGFPGSNNFSQINSTVQFRLFSSVIRNYDTDAITAEDYKKLLYWNAWATYIDGNTAWPDSNEFWADWNPETQHIDYRSWIHHTTLGSSIWTFVEDAMGLRPRTDNAVELSPIDIGWDHFTVNHLRYRNVDLTITWDEPGDGKTYYPGVPEGYSVYIDGERAFTLDSLVPAVWNPQNGQVELTGGEGEVLYHRPAPQMEAPEDVELTGRVVDVFAKAGADLTGEADENLAEGATASASHTAEGTGVDGAIDGTTINAPYWSSAGSGNETDWYEVAFDKPQHVDQVRLYFYRDRTPGGLLEPETYRIEYHDGTEWVPVTGQAAEPAIPRANYNKITFDDVKTDRVRVVMDHQGGHATGLKEFQVFRTKADVPAAENTAPYVVARHDTAFRQPLQAALTGTVKDDGLPLGGELTAQWSLVDGPGSVVFDDPAAATTVATFTEAGEYTLRLTADDGEQRSSSTVTLTVAEPDDRRNVAPAAEPTASYTSPWENVTAINDGIEPPRSNDGTNPRWGTWPEQGEQWVQLDWDTPVRVEAADMYFFDDGGGVRAPASWKIQYRDGDQWVDVAADGPYGVETDQYNQVTFDSVTTTGLRAVMQSGGASVGVLEWKVFAEAPEAVRHVHQPTVAGVVPDLPSTVTCVYADGTRLDLPVVWEQITEDDVAEPATTAEVSGIVTGLALEATATVHVRLHDEVEITALETEEVTTVAGIAPALPTTVTAVYNDGSKDNVTTTVTWDGVEPSQYAEPGTFTVSGTVDGTSLTAEAVITVIEPTTGGDEA